MDRSDAKVKFQDADRLFQAKQYAAALDILHDLNREFPDERHVLYPMARCLTGMRRYPEAREIATRLVVGFGYVPAQELVDRIDRLAAMNDGHVETPVLPSGLDDIVVSPAAFGARTTPPALTRESSGGSWQPYALWVGLLAGSFVLMIVVGLTAGTPFFAFLEELETLSAQGQNDLSDIPPIPWGAVSAVAVSNILFAFLLACFPAYWSLKIVEGLRFGDFGEDMKHVAVTTLIAHALTPVLVIGWIAFPFILKARHELSAGRTLASIFLFFVFDVLTTIPFSIAYNLIVRGSIF